MSEPLDERQLADLAEGVGGEEVLAELLGLYREGLPRQLDRLRAAVKRGEAEEVRLAAHALRSGAAVLGACLLADTAAAAGASSASETSSISRARTPSSSAWSPPSCADDADAALRGREHKGPQATLLCRPMG